MPQASKVFELQKSKTSLKNFKRLAVPSAVEGSSFLSDLIAAAVVWLNTWAARETFIFFPNDGWMCSCVNFGAFRRVFDFSNSKSFTMSPQDEQLSGS